MLRAQGAGGWDKHVDSFCPNDLCLRSSASPPEPSYGQRNPFPPTWGEGAPCFPQSELFLLCSASLFALVIFTLQRRGAVRELSCASWPGSLRCGHTLWGVAGEVGFRGSQPTPSARGAQRVRGLAAGIPRLRFSSEEPTACPHVPGALLAHTSSPFLQVIFFSVFWFCSEATPAEFRASSWL